MLGYLKLPYYKYIANRLIKEHGYKREQFEDRDVLERIIFPYILSFFNPRKILDIGREDYEEFYNEFFHKRELWTIDIDPGKQEFGSIHHITDDVSNIKKYFRDNFFCFILMNGVFGWGLNNDNKVQQTFNAVYDILKPGGIFVLGFNDDIIPLNKIKGLNKLKPYNFKPLNGNSFKCVNGEHKYRFYIK